MSDIPAQLFPMGVYTFATACAHCKNVGSQKCFLCKNEVESGFEFSDRTPEEKRLTELLYKAIEDIPKTCKTCVKGSPYTLKDGRLDDFCRTCLNNKRCNWQWKGWSYESK